LSALIDIALFCDKTFSRDHHAKVPTWNFEQRLGTARVAGILATDAALTAPGIPGVNAH
jgi:hypothetical protein